jgi:hypothetical protein
VKKKKLNVKNWPVMKSHCATCPFGANGDPELQVRVTYRISKLESSQICHHPALKGKPETHLCRGARDIQLKILCAFGMIEEPTDEAFTARSREVGAI